LSKPFISYIGLAVLFATAVFEGEGEAAEETEMNQ